MSIVEGDKTNINRLVLGEQAHAVFKSRLEALPASFCLSISVAVIIHGEVSSVILYTWLTTSLMTTGGQFLFGLLCLKKRRYEKYPEILLNICACTIFISSLIWCFVPLFFINFENKNWAPIILVLCGLTSGAALQGAAYSRVAVLFFTPILLSTILKLFLENTIYLYVFGFDISLFLFYITRASFRSEKLFKSTSILKHQAHLMAQSLKLEHEAANAANARLYQLANHDPLTGLLNRAAFLEYTSARLAIALDENKSLSLLLLDLDGFKPINDTLGHQAGDEVLRQVAGRLSMFGEGKGARLGGDEFAVLLELDGAEASEVAQEIIRQIGQPMEIGRSAVAVGVSIGIATLPDDCTSSDDLRLRADLGLYAAKKAGRNRCHRFDIEMLVDVELSRDLERDLPVALKDGSLQLWYQPQLSLDDHVLVGIEGLIRWHHPKHGWVSPPTIIGIAQRADLSAAVTNFVLDQACATLRTLVGSGNEDLIVAVNLSPAEIEHCALVDILEGKIAIYGVEPRRLELEITEDSLITSQSVIKTLNTLSDRGFRLAIDDFGAGCSSISYLRALKVNRIKIDRGFVTGFTTREDDRRLIQMILGIGKSLDIEVVAEGVESMEEASLLRDLGCRIGQGYHFGRAMPPTELNVWAAGQSSPSLCRQMSALAEQRETGKLDGETGRSERERGFTPPIGALNVA